MIDLTMTRAEMLQSIHAPEDILRSKSIDAAAPDFVSREEILCTFIGSTANELLPQVNAAIMKRFSHIPKNQLVPDLIYLIKKGLGNAYKWGNQKDPEKKICVQLVATCAGAVVAIEDEGKGFDVADLLGQMQKGADYFTCGGSGFDHFGKSKSITSFADDGRTLLIRFLCIPPDCFPPLPDLLLHYHDACNEKLMRKRVEQQVPAFRDGKNILKSCRIYIPERREGEHIELKYILSYREKKSGKVKERTLTGRVLAQTEADAEFSTANRLLAEKLNGHGRARIPRPLAVLKNPSMVLYDFNPNKNLREFMRKIVDADPVAKIMGNLGKSLRVFHRSEVALSKNKPYDPISRFKAALAKTISRVDAVNPDYAPKVRRLFESLLRSAADHELEEKAFIHGAFVWNNILHDGKYFYFYRFDRCEIAHPGYDIASFLLDLFRYYKLKNKKKQKLFAVGKEAFMDSYFGRKVPAWANALPFFFGIALLEHLESKLALDLKSDQTLATFTTKFEYEQISDTLNEMRY